METEQVPTLVGEEDDEVPELEEDAISEAEIDVLADDNFNEEDDLEEDSDEEHSQDENPDESQKDTESVSIEPEHVQKKRKLGIAAEKVKLLNIKHLDSY